MNARHEQFDAVIVGARCAGAATAMLMARAGLRVLVVDRTHPSRDTLSTHALMRAGVVQLSRWGLLQRVVAAGTPPVTATTFHYGDRTETLQLTEPLYAPRRTVLDTALLSAAREAGAQARFGVGVTELCRDRTGRVTGVLARVRGGDAVTFRAPLDGGPAGRCPDGASRRSGERARVRLLAESVGLALRLVLPAGGERGDHPDQ
jgi:2-polyprenyl-6-methoxyphenol hydroxylase-like FAD-dependent oxidoreductase